MRIGKCQFNLKKKDKGPSHGNRHPFNIALPTVAVVKLTFIFGTTESKYENKNSYVYYGQNCLRPLGQMLM